MKTFKIEIQEFFSKVVELKAENLENALIKAKEMYNNGEIVLTYEDIVETEINEFISES